MFEIKAEKRTGNYALGKNRILKLGSLAFSLGLLLSPTACRTARPLGGDVAVFPPEEHPQNEHPTRGDPAHVPPVQPPTENSPSDYEGIELAGFVAIPPEDQNQNETDSLLINVIGDPAIVPDEHRPQPEE